MPGLLRSLPAAMMAEYRSITAHRGEQIDGFGVILAVLAGIAVLASLFSLTVGAGILAALMAFIAFTGGTVPETAARPWAILGASYIGLAGIAAVALREFPEYGVLMIFWAGFVVTAADVGGYFAGRFIGGPKLWPAISPKKTWAGAGGRGRSRLHRRRTFFLGDHRYALSAGLHRVGGGGAAGAGGRSGRIRSQAAFRGQGCGHADSRPRWRARPAGRPHDGDPRCRSRHVFAGRGCICLVGAAI